MWLPVPFPPRIAMGCSCEPNWQVTVTGVLSGDEYRTLDWADCRHEYDAGLAVRTESDYEDVVNHWHMARGKLHSFPFKDPVDYRCTAARGVVLRDEEASPAVFQLHKRYGDDSDFAYYRRISRLIPGKFMLFEGPTLLNSGSDYTVDEDTGIVVTAIDPTLLSWSGQFYVPCRYDIEKLPTKVINRNGGQGQLILSAASIPLMEVRDRPL